jgi:4-hydroxy-tetrahydrodipicolinate synthase
MRALVAEDCHNVLVVAITPRDGERAIDLEGIRRNVRHLCAQGVDFIMPECGTGLVYDATLAEYEAVVATYMEAAGEDALVVPGIGPGYGRAVEMGQIARSLGVAGVMIMPIVGPASANGVRTGLADIATKTQLPTILYQRRLDITPVEQVVELCRMDEVVGLKYAVDDLETFKRIEAGAGADAAMVCGMAEDPCIDYMAAGAVGFSSGMANFTPRMSLTILRRFAQGDREGAEEIRRQMVPFEDFRGERAARYSSSALHAAMDRAGRAGGPVVPFAEDVAEEDLPRLHELVDELMQIENQMVAEVV